MLPEFSPGTNIDAVGEETSQVSPTGPRFWHKPHSSAEIYSTRIRLVFHQAPESEKRASPSLCGLHTDPPLPSVRHALGRFRFGVRSRSVCAAVPLFLEKAGV